MLIQNKVIGTVAYLGGLHGVLEEFTWCWGQLIQFSYEYHLQQGESIYFNRARISYHAMARNGLVKEMQGDWLLQLDTDHQFEPDVLVRLLQIMRDCNADVVSALYHNKSFPHPATVYAFDEEGKPRVIGDWPKETRAFQVDSCGAGTLLVKREVFDRIESELHEEPFNPIATLGEDHSFFTRCKRLGIRCFVAPAVESYHMAIHPVRHSDSALDSMSLGDGPEVEGIA